METNAKIQYSVQRILIGMLFFLLISGATHAKNVTGLVKDRYTKDPMPGVGVVLKNTTVGSLTNFDGKFSLTIPEGSQVLVFSYIGYQTVEKKIIHDSIIDVFMKAEIPELQEVIIISREEKKSMEACGSVVSVAAFQSSSPAPLYFNPSIEEYSKIHENGFKDAQTSPLSTFSIDVDRASYSNIRRFLNQGQNPPADAVRIEEMVNYFDYNYPQPTDDRPFSITTEVGICPWQPLHRLVHIGIQGKKIETENLPASNLVFLLDVSGSMSDANKLPLLKKAFGLLVDQLREKDRVAIVVYAGAAGIVLPSTSGKQKDKILQELDHLEAGGSTAGGAGIQLAYKVALENFIKNGNNRIILATDGDFNVGVSNGNDLETLISEKRKSGVYLTCLGFGMGNYKDSKMETLADKGNGNYSYINDIQEAQKVFVGEFGGTLFTIAKDVKLQIEFNPEFVQAYRLVGYENRMLNNEDFKDDTKDAGEIGAGHTVTALYEIIPMGVKSELVKPVDELKYSIPGNGNNNQYSNEVATLKCRYKKPDGDVSIEMVHPIASLAQAIEKTSDNFRFSSSVAMFGMLLRNSEFKGENSKKAILALAQNSMKSDSEGYKAEFIRLVKSYRADDPVIGER